MLGGSDGMKGHRREEASDGTEREKERERQEGPATKEGTRGEADAGENATIARLIVRSRALTWRPSPPDAAPPSSRTRDSQIRRSCEYTHRHTSQYVHFGLIHKYASSAHMHRSIQYAHQVTLCTPKRMHVRNTAPARKPTATAASVATLIHMLAQARRRSLAAAGSPAERPACRPA